MKEKRNFRCATYVAVKALGLAMASCIASPAYSVQTPDELLEKFHSISHRLYFNKPHYDAVLKECSISIQSYIYHSHDDPTSPNYAWHGKGGAGYDFSVMGGHLYVTPFLDYQVTGDLTWTKKWPLDFGPQGDETGSINFKLDSFYEGPNLPQKFVLYFEYSDFKYPRTNEPFPKEFMDNCIVSYSSVQLTGGPTQPTSEDFTLTAEFSEPVEMFAPDDLVYSGAEITDVTTSDNRTFTLHVSPNGGEDISIHIPENTTVSLEEGAGHMASNTFALAWAEVDDLPSEVEEAVRNTVTRLTTSQLRQTLKRHDDMARGATARIGGQGAVPLSFSGSLDADGGAATTAGTLYGVQDHGRGLRTILEGAFDINRDSEGLRRGSVYLRGSLEQDLSPKSLGGLFVEGEYVLMDFDDAYSGSQRSTAVFGGAYLAHAFGPALFGHAYAGIGTGRHALDMGNDRFSVDGDYDTQTVEIGAGLTGEYDLGWAMFAPGVSMLYGRTRIGEVAVDGTYLGSDVTGDVAVDAVSMARARMMASFALPIDTYGGPSTTLTVAPNLLCERVVAAREISGCGYGLGLGLSVWDLNVPSLELSFDVERVNDLTTYGINAMVSHRF